MNTETDLIEELESADSIPSLYDHCYAIAQSLDFSYFVYLTRVPVSLSRPYMFAISGYPPDWVQHYQSRNYFAIDPVYAHVENSLKPLLWDEVPRDNAAIQSFFEDADKHGVGQGITIPIYGRGGELALFSVARAEALPAEAAERRALVSQIQSFVPHIHEQVKSVALDKGDMEVLKPTLTEREIDCLRWAGDGKTTWEISRILDISERTVFYHLSQANDKLGVNSRPQAVAKAVSSGQMDSFYSAVDHLTILDTPVPPQSSALH